MSQWEMDTFVNNIGKSALDYWKSRDFWMKRNLEYAKEEN